MKSLFQTLSETNTEEELKNFFAKRFKIKLATKNFINLRYTACRNTMITKIQPTAIVVCGKCPDWLEIRFPDIQIVKIKNYSQLWHERSKK